MKRIYTITVLSALVVIALFYGIYPRLPGKASDRTIKVGFVYIGDASTPYTSNFLKAQEAIEEQFGESVETIAKYNIAEGEEEGALQELIDAGCELIFTTSYGYGETVKRLAEEYPDIQFCQATCSNANEEPLLENYHTYMGAIYQGRYVSGVVAGMKLQELIDEGTITTDEAKIGYVGAYPFAEVISGYTAFFLGVRSVVPEVRMTVKYTNSWSNYKLEKDYARELIDEGCVIISQHSDTAGPAVACEETDALRRVYHVGYNESMTEIAPTTSLIACRINWEPYMAAAVQAVLLDKDIESFVDGNVNGNDVGGGFKQDWVQMLELNKLIAAKGTQDKIDELLKEFRQGKVSVFYGDYIGVDPDDETDQYDLNKEYIENATSSAPTFHYVLRDVITIE